MKKVDEIKNLVDDIIELLSNEGRTMNEKDFNMNVGQLMAYVQILCIKNPRRDEMQYTQSGVADNVNFWKRQRKANKERAIKLDYFNKSAEELKAELKKAEDDKLEAYKIKDRCNQTEVVDAVERQYAAKYALNNIE